MTNTVVTSVSSRSRIERARAWLETRDAAEEVLILGASLGAANELARSLAKTKGAAFGWHRLTLVQLAVNIASPVLTERGLASISQIGAEATVARLLHRLRIERGLGRFQPIAHTPGFPRAITAVLTELRLAQLSAQDLAAIAPDVSPLLAAYQAELAEFALADWPQILALAAEGVLTHWLSGLPLLMFDVPIGSQAELTFLRALSTRAPEILATVPAADKPSLAKIRDDLHWQIEDLDLQPTFVPDPDLHRLQRNLFKEATTVAATNPATSVDIFSAPGEGRETGENMLSSRLTAHDHFRTVGGSLP
jgi:ATP-dependent helicase/nuclease subunit B